MASNVIPVSTRASLNSRHANSKRESIMHRRVSDTRGHNRPPVPPDEAFSYALRAAYLAYLLQPRQKRVQHVANTSKPIQRSSMSIQELVKDFSLVRDSKSTRIPRGFTNDLDKRITGVLLGQEKGPEYKDAVVKRTFATFLNEFKKPDFRKTMENDRRVEDMVLIFYSRATRELQQGKAPDDDSWKWMVDRHVALFVRLVASTLHSNTEWTREKPELSARLKTLEIKLLQNDQNLADTSQPGVGGQGGQSIEVEIPRSYEVKDMPLVVRVCRIFAKPTATAQETIDANRHLWTEKAALKDLKDYQNHMMLNTHVTLSRDDFDRDEAFESWRKGEYADLSQMMLAIIQSNPELAKTNSSVPNLRAGGAATQSDSAAYADVSRTLSPQSVPGAEGTSYAVDQPVDMSHLNIDDHSPHDSVTASMDASQAKFTFIPLDTRGYYRAVLQAALTHDLTDEDLPPPGDDGQVRLLTKQSHDMLNEIALRWRVPLFTRAILLLDVVREKFQNQEVTLEIVDSAFSHAKEPPPPSTSKSKGTPAQFAQAGFADRSKWARNDFSLYKSMLSTLHDALLRALFELFQHCYETKPPSIGAVMFILENHIYSDELSPRHEADAGAFTQTLREALREKARNKYHELLAANVSDNAAEWEFFHIVQLGKAVTGLCEKIQKRYRKNPTVLGVNPLSVLVVEMLPAFADDAKELVRRIMELSRAKGPEGDVPVQDGFDLYKELVEIRRVYLAALPGRPFEFPIESLLQEFVWRWLAQMDEKLVGWIEGAVAQDQFQIRQDSAAKEQGIPPTDEERRSQSALDVYRIFHQCLDQLLGLEWDDDLQYARFMTALSKSIGRGVARYCELLEAKFAKEMDRQTPEQEMRAQQTTQQRWLAAARDLYERGGKGGIGGEKIEPFQFWAESFVKINDIEYATLQLDQVEKEVNVDACAEVIQRLDPPPPQNFRNKQSKCVFTIKIIEAEDLKAGDMNGLSDPYVVLGDEYQKRLAKTRTVYQSLNPRWDETVDIVTTGPLNIIATVWDWDLVGDHDCLGRTSLKLDPAHFNDYLPREYWLDLDTQGRVLVRVSMEGERDDIQFHFAKAFRTLKRTERDMTRKVTDKLSAYIRHCLSRRTLRALLSASTSTTSAAALGAARDYFSKLSGRPSATPATPNPPGPAPTNPHAISQALQPLLKYFDDNFAIMKQTLTDSAMITVMTRLWKEVLVTLEALLVPPLSDKPSAQKPLSQQEVDIVYRWLQILFDFFHAIDEETGQPNGVPLDVLRSPKYHDLQNLAFFYSESTDNLIRTSEAMATATVTRQHETAARLNRLSAPAGVVPPGSLGPSIAGTRRTKSIMLSRNLGTMRRAKEEKRREAQAEPSDDMILRILRMRPEAEKYLKDRSRQKERLAAAAAAEAIVRQSLMASRQAAVGQQGGGLARGGGLGRRWDTIRE